MPKQSRLARTWSQLDRFVRNTVDPRNWPGSGVIPWNRQPTDISTSQDFDLIDLGPKDYYKGQLFSSIRTRANKVADMAKEHVETRLFDDPEKELTEADQHPYLTLINESPKFTNTFFWKSLSTYLDLPGGMAYVFVLRSFGNNGLRGTPKEFQVVNPYRLTKVRKQSNSEEYKYVEMRPDGAWREIPEEQLVIVRSFNPFNPAEGYGISEAATDDQYQISQARSYSRQAIRDNVGQRGMLSPEVVLQDEAYKNFEQAIVAKSRTGKGKFLTTNSPVRYTDMQVDLDKLALETINKISHETITSVTGASKTILAIEQSGVTRETSNVQRDMFSEFHIIPQLTDILDALNQDYKNSYPNEYESKKVEMYVDSPLKVDKDRELKEAQIDKTKAEAAKVLIDTGYDPASVSEFLELEDLEFEERQPKGLPIPAGTLSPNPDPDKQTDEDTEDQQLREFTNKFAPGLEVVVTGLETTLANQVSNIDGQVFQALIPKLGTVKNAQDLNQEDERRLRRELELALAAFGVAVVSLFAGQTVSKRTVAFALPAEFTMTPAVNKAIKAGAKRSAESHISTFTEAVFRAAREAGIEGLSREAIVSRLSAMYPDLARTNATRIARTESYKAVNLAQFEADKQFIAQNDLGPRAYKKWVTQSRNPCQYCIEMSKRPAVPFNQAFVDLGDSVKAEFKQDSGTVTREYVADFEPVESGTLHPNCSCTYSLIIK